MSRGERKPNWRSCATCINWEQMFEPDDTPAEQREGYCKMMPEQLRKLGSDWCGQWHAWPKEPSTQAPADKAA